MRSTSKQTISVKHLSRLDPGIASLWISSNGYESRSTAHLEFLKVPAAKSISYGFDFDGAEATIDVVKRISEARLRLKEAGFLVYAVDDIEFEAMFQQELSLLNDECRVRIVADISSMSRSRIAALILACVEKDFTFGCDLDIVYFPSTYESHKHLYEPLEYFGPCHRRIAGWPEDPDLPLALLIGLGTEPRRADGIVEMLEPDILALFIPVGDEAKYAKELVRENRRLLEVGGQPVSYSVRNSEDTFGRLLGTASSLAERSRLVMVPLGPKIFCALSIVVALVTGPEVGVWKASAGKGVMPIDVHAETTPVLFRIIFP